MNTRSTRTQHVAILTVTVLFAIGNSMVYAHNPPPPPPPFKCYQLAEKGGALNTDVTLTDQFRVEAVKLDNPHFLCTPVSKKCVGQNPCEEFDVNDEANPAQDHLLCWKIAPSGPPVSEEVTAQGSEFEENKKVTVQTGQLLCEFVTKIRKQK